MCHPICTEVFFIHKKYLSLRGQGLYNSHSALFCKSWWTNLAASHPSASTPTPDVATDATADSGSPKKYTGSLLGKKKKKPDHTTLAEIQKQIDSTPTPAAEADMGSHFEFTSDYPPKCVKIKRCPEPGDVWQFFWELKVKIMEMK